MPSERAILSKLRRRVSPAGAHLALGIGDDCAIYRPPPGQELLFTTDFSLEGVHFLRATHTPAQIGYKALARGLSDIAAMGATPRFCLVSLAAPANASSTWISRFYDGLLSLAGQSHTQLAGGDLAQSDRVICDIVVCGSAPRGTSLRRGGAQPGDAIYVSGALGASALGLATQRGPAWKRHKCPEPRLALGAYLRGRIHATAAMDLSDGLSLDLHRLCLESGVSAHIHTPPIYPGASESQALHGGEDYELLFTAAPRVSVPSHFAALPLTRIGEIQAGRPGSVLYNGKRLTPQGYDHFG